MKNIMATMKSAVPTLMKRGVAFGVTISLLHVSLAVAMPITDISGSAALGDDAAISIPVDSGIELERRTVSISAYTASVNETDDTPCYTANGDDICDPEKGLTAAMNGVPFGTQVWIPELGDDAVYTINDRMNARYNSNYMDIHVLTKAQAFKFGRQSLEIVILD